MRILHVSASGVVELPSPPEAMPGHGFLWLACQRSHFEAELPGVQAHLQRWTGGQLVDLHVADMLNPQLPSTYDYTSWYDVLVFRRLVAVKSEQAAPITSIDTSPVGFAVFDRVLVTIHPGDCAVRDYFAQRLEQMKPGVNGYGANDHGNGGNGRNGGIAGDVRGLTRLPTSPADLMLRMVNHIVDSYLDLRRLLTPQLDGLQRGLLEPKGRVHNWQVLLDARNLLHVLEDTCEDQRAAVQEWIDALDEWPPAADPLAARERELLSVRSRDVLEHIERVLTHVRRLEQSAEAAVQMHFSAVGQRTNDIMRTLTVLTAVFLPLNLITGIFGMNFDALPLIHRQTGFWIAVATMVMVGIGLVGFFWRKRYLGARAHG